MNLSSVIKIDLLVMALVVGAIAWGLSRAPAPVIEQPAAEVRQDDGSVVVEKKPDAKAKPKHKIPKGTTVERTVEVSAQGQGVTLPTGEIAPCPPVTIDLTLVREQDGQRRVVASARDGQILKAVDIPIEAAAAPPEPRVWAAGLSLDPIHQGFGAWVERDIGRVRVGLEINQQRAAVLAGVSARVRVGWVW